jgi:antitoxin component of MazEF toxin-antitoxin module
MVKGLTRHGNSLALVLDKPILDLLNIAPDTLLKISTDGESLVLSPVRGAKDEAKLEAALAKAHKRYGRMLKRLAE